MTTEDQTTPFRLGRLAPCIAVTDIARAIAFYRDLFGLEKTFENGAPVRFAILKRGEAEFHLTLDPAHRASSNNVAHLLVGDATALYDRCTARGVTIVRPLRDHDYGLRAFVLADPDGNRIDVGQPI